MEKDTYGDGNVYRGVRSKDSEIETIVVKMIPKQDIECWKINYGLDTRTPEEAAAWWSEKLDNKAPSGAVAALGICLNEIERSDKILKRLIAAAENVIKKTECKAVLSEADLSWLKREVKLALEVTNA